jgi:hypothetical protein
MKTLDEFLKQLEAPEGYYCFSSHSESNETRIEGPIKIEQLKNSLKIKAAKIIREMKKTLELFELPATMRSHDGWILRQVYKEISEILNEKSE